MSSSGYTPARRTARHCRHSNITSSSLTPKPINEPNIAFCCVKDDGGEEVGRVVVYEPLEVDPSLSQWSDFVTTLVSNRGAYLSIDRKSVV